MSVPKTIEYTNALGELQILDPSYYKDNVDINGYFEKYDEFQKECTRKFNIMYDKNYRLINEIQLTPDEEQYITNTKVMYETQDKHQQIMLPREVS